MCFLTPKKGVLSTGQEITSLGQGWLPRGSPSSTHDLCICGQGQKEREGDLLWILEGVAAFRAVLSKEKRNRWRMTAEEGPRAGA